MVFDIRKIPFSKRIADHFKDFEIPKFEYDEVADKLLRYTIFLYDKESDLREIPEIAKRKKEAAKLAKLPKSPDPEDVLFIKIQRCFFHAQADKKYELLVSGEELFSQLMIKVRQPVPKNDKTNPEREMKTYEIKTKCFYDAEKIRLSIKQLETELFQIEEEPTGQERTTLRR